MPLESTPNNTSNRRLKLIYLPPDCLLDALQGYVRISKLPADLVLRRFGYDPFTDSWVLVVESETFPEVPESQCLEVMRLELHRETGHTVAALG